MWYGHDEDVADTNGLTCMLIVETACLGYAMKTCRGSLRIRSCLEKVGKSGVLDGDGLAAGVIYPNVHRPENIPTEGSFLPHMFPYFKH
jgi:hypothetical protein